MDESPTLLGAAANAFTQFSSINEYLDGCMNSLLTNNDVDLPQCFLRIDRSHFVKSILRNVKKGLSETKRIIRGVLGYLITCYDLNEATFIITHLFTLSCNEYNSAHVENAYQKLLQIVRTHEGGEIDLTMDKLASTTDNTSKHSQKKDRSYKETSNYKWILQIIQTIPIEPPPEIPKDSNSTANTFNAFYAAKTYQKYLIRTLVRMPLWSNIMVKKFNSKNICASSSPVENVFKDIKRNLCFKKKRVDLFLKKHVNQQVSATRPKKRSMSVDAKKDVHGETMKRRKRSLSLEAISEHDKSDESFENWRNKGKLVLISKTQCKVRRAAHSILSKQDLTYFHNDIPLLENGKNTKDDNNIITEFTCVFDSIYAILSVAALDYNCTEITTISTSQLLAKKTTKNFSHLYSLRNEILKSVFLRQNYVESDNLTINTENGLTYIDCFTGVGGFFSELVYEDNDHLSSYTVKTTCSDCNLNRVKVCPFVPVEINLEGPISLGDVQSIIRDNDRSMRCLNCKKRMHCTREVNKIITVEVEPPSSKHAKLCRISEIENEIVFGGTKFKLIGAIENVGRHFIAHAIRKNDRWETIDDLADGRSRKFNDGLKNFFLLFYVNEMQ